MDTFDDSLAFVKFGVGQPVPRKEDPTLLRGQGRYTDDINLAGPGLCGDGAQPQRARSPEGHRHVRGASDMPGVLAILTAADLDEAGFGPLMCPLNIPQRDGTPMKTPPRWSLAKDKVRFVGEVVAVRGGRDGAAGQGRRGSRDARHRGTAGRDRPRSGAGRRRAADP